MPAKTATAAYTIVSYVEGSCPVTGQYRSAAHAMANAAKNERDAADSVSSGGPTAIEIYEGDHARCGPFCKIHEEDPEPVMSRTIDCTPAVPACGSRHGHKWDDVSRPGTGVPGYDDQAAVCARCGLRREIVGDHDPTGKAGMVTYLEATS